ncbi:MAG: LruC domain-containing protein [Planctomycetota bacterium]|nr:MAG: LruC domain-containing protein [Planctomycetota bacterium]
MTASDSHWNRLLRRVAQALLGRVELRASWPLLALAVMVSGVSAQGAGPTTPRQFVDGFVSLPESVLTQVGELLPEQSNANAHFLSDTYSPNLLMQQDATVSVTFVHEGADYHNTLGYFTYTLNPFTIVDRQLIFPDVSFSELASGDRSTLRDANGDVRQFNAGELIGFFLVADGYRKSNEIKQNWSPLSTAIPSEDPADNYQFPQQDLHTFLTIDEANPENDIGRSDIARHTAMLVLDGIPGFEDGEDFVLMGFEDLLRTVGDNDFNDAVFLVQSTPPQAYATSFLATAVDDPDEDGVIGLADAYPLDSERALVLSYPSFGWNGVGLEDLYPAIGDGDYNDTVMMYRFDLVLSATGMLKDVRGTFHLLARGGSFDHRLGLHFPDLPDGTEGTIEVERFLSDDEDTHVIETPLEIATLIDDLERRLETILPSSALAMPGLPGKFLVNTTGEGVDRQGASSRLMMTFDEAIDLADFGAPPWDLYWSVNDGNGWLDVHFAGFDAFEDRPEGLPEETGPEAFLDEQGYPWMIEVPFNWRFPLESTFIGQAYPSFLGWAASHGSQFGAWYDTPTNSKVSSESGEYLVNRDWSVTLPDPTVAP